MITHKIFLSELNAFNNEIYILLLDYFKSDIYTHYLNIVSISNFVMKYMKANNIQMDTDIINNDNDFYTKLMSKIRTMSNTCCSKSMAYLMYEIVPV